MSLNKRFGAFGLVATLGVLAPTLGFNAFPEGENSAAQTTARVTNLHLLDSETPAAGWTTIMSSQLKCAQQKDVFVGVSIEAGLITKTLVRSKNGERDTSDAEAAIKIRVLLDGVEAEPGEVIFARRRQMMSAVFQGLIADSFYIDPDGNVVLDESTVEPEELELLLDTTSAASFNFLKPDLAAGMHKIEVQAQIDTNTSASAGEASAYGLIGKGSVTVQEVRCVQGDDIEMN